MPGFLGHTAGNAVVLAGTTAVMATQGWSAGDILTVDAGIVIANFILSPDLDLFNSRSMDDWGWMRIFWWPYAKMVKHRDMMHTPVLGTSVRWIYMAIVLSIVIVPLAIILRRMNFSVTFKGDADDILWYIGYVADLLIGASLADAMHFLLDITTTRLKRAIPRRFRPRYERYIQNHSDRHQRLPPGYPKPAMYAGNRRSEKENLFGERE